VLAITQTTVVIGAVTATAAGLDASVPARVADLVVIAVCVAHAGFTGVARGIAVRGSATVMAVRVANTFHASQRLRLTDL
jgi:hypothetical protein